MLILDTRNCEQKLPDILAILKRTKPSTNMLQFRPKYDFLREPERAIHNYAPYTIALTDLMMICGVYGLFNKKDVLELLRRTQILFPGKNMLENFLSKNSLLTFHIDEVRFELDFEILLIHLGYEILEYPNQYVPFEEWMEKGPAYQMPTVHQAHFLEKPYLDYVELDYDFFLRWLEPDLSQENLQKIEFLLSAVSKELPEELFHQIAAARKKNKVNGFEEPVFNFEAYPKQKQEALWKHFWPDMENFDDPYERQNVIDKLYFGWLWTNGFIEEFQGYLPLVDSRISDFYYEYYIVNDDYYLFEEIINNDNIKELMPLLEEPKARKMAEMKKGIKDIDFLKEGF